MLNQTKKVCRFIAVGGLLLLGVNSFYHSFNERYLVQISPFGKIYLAGDESQINHVFISDRRGDHWNYAILTNKKEEIEALFNDLVWTWNTNLKSPPNDEIAYQITFDDDDEPSAHNGFLTYYPESDTIVFFGREQNTVSLHSSEVLRNLFNNMNFMDAKDAKQALEKKMSDIERASGFDITDIKADEVSDIIYVYIDGLTWKDEAKIRNLINKHLQQPTKLGLLQAEIKN